MPEICCFGYTPDPDCDNCDGTGVFSTDESGDPYEPCAFCLEDAILRGELDGTVGKITYRAGVAVLAEAGQEDPCGRSTSIPSTSPTS